MCKRRGNSEENSGKERNNDGKPEEANVQRRWLQERNSSRRNGNKDPHQEIGKAASKEPSGHRQEQAFCQSLPSQTLTACTESSTHGEFTLSRYGAHQEQVRHVGAGKKQNGQD